MSLIDDFLSLTEDLPPRPADAYESHHGQLWFRAIVLLLLPLVIALPRLSGKLTAADEEAVAAYCAHPGAAAIRQAITLESRLIGGHLGFQLTSTALHAGNVLLVWLILRRLRVPGAWLVAAAFAVHPIQLQSISWIGQQDRLWAAMCYLGSVLLLLSFAGVPALVLDGNPYSDGTVELPVEPDSEPPPGMMRRWLTYLAAMTLFVAGMWFQPTGVGVAVVVLILVAWARGWRRSDWLLFVPLCAIAAASMAAAAVFHKELGFSDPLGRTFSVQGHLAWAVDCAGRTATRIVWPFPVISSPPDDSVPLAKVYLSVVVILVGLAALWLLRRRIGTGPVVAFACFFCLIPTLADVGGGSQFSAFVPGRDAFGYLAAIPLIALVIAVLARSIATLTKSAPAVAVAAARALLGAAIIAPAMVLTWCTSYAYANTETLWQTAAESNPTSLRPCVRLSEWYLSQGKVAEAEQQLTRVDPGTSADIDALLARGRVFEARRDIEGALRCYVRAIGLDQGNTQVRDRLADAYAAGGDPAAAPSFFERALQEHRGDPSLLNDYGLFLGRRGDHVAAAQQFRAAIAADENFSPARVNLASILFERGELAEAADQLQAVVKIDPRNFDAFHNAGVMLCQLKDFEKAEAMLRVAVRLRPDSPE